MIFLIFCHTYCTSTVTSYFVRYVSTCSSAAHYGKYLKPITWQKLKAFRHVDVVKFKLRIRMWKKGDVEHEIIVSAIRAGLNISESTDPLISPHSCWGCNGVENIFFGPLIIN